MNPDDLVQNMGVTDQSGILFEKLKEKPEEFFEVLKEQGFKEELKNSLSDF